MGDAGAAAPSSSDEAHSINIKEFTSRHDDFERWVKRFEKAVKLSTTRRDDATLHYLYKEWLPLKLDDLANNHLERMDADGLEWPDLKAKLGDLLVDPQQKLQWRARQITITWDGKESIHMLESRVVRAVDKFDRNMPQAVKDEEYFVRFRSAFKKTLRRVIDMNCAEENRTIKAAKNAVMRYLMAASDEENNNVKPKSSSVILAGARLSSDCAPGIEDSLAAVADQLEDMSISLRAQDSRMWNLERRLGDLEERIDRHGCFGNHRLGSSSAQQPQYGRSYKYRDSGPGDLPHQRRSYTRCGERSPSWSSSEEDERHSHARRNFHDEEKSPSHSSSNEDEAYQHLTARRKGRQRVKKGNQPDRNSRR